MGVYVDSLIASGYGGYLAGFFDGEGTVELRFVLHKKKGYFSQIRVSISNTNLEILEKIKEIYGGYILNRGKRTPNRRNIYVWQAASRVAANFLENILP